MGKKDENRDPDLMRDMEDSDREDLQKNMSDESDKEPQLLAP